MYIYSRPADTSPATNQKHAFTGKIPPDTTYPPAPSHRVGAFCGHRVGAFCGHGPGHPRENDTYDVQRSDAAAVTGTRAQSGENKKFAVCTGTQNDQMAGTSTKERPSILPGQTLECFASRGERDQRTHTISYTKSASDSSPA